MRHRFILQLADVISIKSAFELAQPFALRGKSFGFTRSMKALNPGHQVVHMGQVP